MWQEGKRAGPSVGQKERVRKKEGKWGELIEKRKVGRGREERGGPQVI